jgi:alkyl hydroperoxide reductase subunit AhpF
MESDRVTADCVEATEFPDLVNRYHVSAVPKTVINGEAFVEGALPEQAFLDRILGSGDTESPEA